MQKTSPIILYLSTIFVGCLLISNILANEMIQLGPWSVDAGNLLFPVTYILSDVFSEVYGYKWSRRITFIACMLNALMVILIQISIALPKPDWFDGIYFETALATSVRIVIASVISYYIGDLVNDRIFHIMKSKSVGLEGFGLRAIISSLMGECVDTILFVTIAFAGITPVRDLVNMIIITVVLKTGYEVLILPITYKVVKFVKLKEDI